MMLFDRAEKKRDKEFKNRRFDPGVRRCCRAVLAGCAALVMVVAGTLYPAFSGTAWANDSEIRIADGKGDWGYPTPFRHYPRGPGYVRMSWVFDTWCGKMKMDMCRRWLKNGPMIRRSWRSPFI